MQSCVCLWTDITCFHARAFFLFYFVSFVITLSHAADDYPPLTRDGGDNSPTHTPSSLEALTLPELVSLLTEMVGCNFVITCKCFCKYKLSQFTYNASCLHTPICLLTLSPPSTNLLEVYAHTLVLLFKSAITVGMKDLAEALFFATSCLHLQPGGSITFNL